MTLSSLLETAEGSVPGLSAHDTMVLALAWARIYLDGEEEDGVTKWARRQVGCEPTDDELRELRTQGMSLRTMANAFGMSKTTVARRLSHLAA